MNINISSWMESARGAIARIGWSVAVAGCLGLALQGCAPSVKSGRGFQLPEGNPALGRQAFIDLKCYTCHRVDGVADLPAPTEPAEKVIVLGGEVARARTYGRLMTSIIHPSQSISEKLVSKDGKKVTKSPMPSVNETMTVAQLINLVTFLQPQYRELQPIYEQYTIMY